MQTVFNQFVYFAFFQSLFLLALYIMSPKNRRNLNGYIAFLVLVLFIGLSGRVLYISEIFGRNFRLIGFSEFATLLFGSTVYLFTRAILSNRRFSKEDLVHYIPALFYSVFVIFYFMLPSDEIISNRVRTGELFRTITLLMGTGLLFNITYWGLALQQFFKMRERLKDELSYSVKTTFMANFLMLVGVCLIAWLIVYIISVLNLETVEREARQFIWLSIAFIILFIAYYSIISPNIFNIQSLQVVEKYTQSKLRSEDLDKLKDQLETLMHEKKPHLNSKLMKAELADLMGISNPELARLLNETIGMNFFEFINYYRIKEFIALAKTDKAKNLTFFGLAQEAGFNSKTTFNKSFKKLMGASPSDYLNKT